MLLLGGSHHAKDNYQGAFQEGPPSHAAMVAPYVKFSANPSSLSHFDFCLHKALSECINGRPGASYIELPENLLTQALPATAAAPAPTSISMSRRLFTPSRSQADPSSVLGAINALKSASKPLVLIGKGCGYSRAEKEILALVETFKIPFVAMPMGKGVISDAHPLNASAARSTALSGADVVLVLGARLNWLLRYGAALNPSALVIQVDISAEELGLLETKLDNSASTANNSRSENKKHIALCGDIACVVSQLLGDTPVSSTIATPRSHTKEWIETLCTKSKASQAKVAALIEQKITPTPSSPHWMSYYNALGSVARALHVFSPTSPPEDLYSVLVSEGANTMDMSRILLPSHRPRARLDAGTYAAMGPAFGYAIASAVASRGVFTSGGVSATKSVKPVVAVVGDSSFGFSCIEIETAVRYRLPIVVVVINNNGIYSGTEHIIGEPTLGGAGSESSGQPTALNLGLELPVTALSPNARYHEMAIALGAHSMSCSVTSMEDTTNKIREATEAAVKVRLPVVINVLIRPEGNSSKLASSDAFFAKSKEQVRNKL